MSFGHWSGDRIEDHEAFCAGGCGRLAETEIPAGLTSSGTEVVDLVCHPCRAKLLSLPLPAAPVSTRGARIAHALLSILRKRNR